MKREVFLKSVAIYYAKAAVFTVASYGLLLLIYGRTKISFFEWVLILLAAFTVGYIPTFIRLLRGKEV
ncbi:MAG: hypothetical protein ACK4FW_00360 [Stenotrophomonas sp.]